MILMSLTHHLKTHCKAIGLEFWLPLPLVGILFWLGGEWVTGQALSQPRQLSQPLTINSQQQVTLVLNLLSIEVQIRQSSGYAKVEVMTTNPTLRKLEFEFPVLDPDLISAQLAAELGLPVTEVERLARYRFD